MPRSECVIFRATPDFVALLARAAEVAGISKSEAIRRAVSAQATAQ